LAFGVSNLKIYRGGCRQVGSGFGEKYTSDPIKKNCQHNISRQDIGGEYFIIITQPSK